MQPAPRHSPRTNAALLVMLVLGNLVFGACLGLRWSASEVEWHAAPAERPQRIAWLQD